MKPASRQPHPLSSRAAGRGTQRRKCVSTTARQFSATYSALLSRDSRPDAAPAAAWRASALAPAGPGAPAPPASS